MSAHSGTVQMTDGGPRLVYSKARGLRSARLAEADDRTLLEELRQGDELALDELVRRKTQPLVQACFRILGDLEEARDVVQMTFLKVWNHRGDYDRRYSPNTWIYRIATNLSIDHLRSRQTRDRAHEPLKHHLRWHGRSRELGAQRDLDDAEVMEIFSELGEGLTDRQRAIFVLREIEGLSSREVSEIVGCRESTVRNHLFNARRILREALIERYPEYAGRHGREDSP